MGCWSIGRASASLAGPLGLSSKVDFCRGVEEFVGNIEHVYRGRWEEVSVLRQLKDLESATNKTKAMDYGRVCHPTMLSTCWSFAISFSLWHGYRKTQPHHLILTCQQLSKRFGRLDHLSLNASHTQPTGFYERSPQKKTPIIYNRAFNIAKAWYHAPADSPADHWGTGDATTPLGPSGL